jgi:hypothetical protein
MAEKEDERPRFVTVMIPCERGEPGSYLPKRSDQWYRDVKVNLATGKTDLPLDAMDFVQGGLL